MSLLDIFDGGASKAAKEKEKGIAKAMEASKAAYQPFIDRGNTAFGKYDAGLNNMQNPAEYINKATSSYKPSEGYNSRLTKILDVIRNNAAQQGTLGTGQQDKQIADYTSGLLDEDMETYLKHYFDTNNSYLQGEGNVANQGYDSASKLGQSLTGLNVDQGNAKAEGQLAKWAPWNDLLKTGINAAANYATGGGFGVLSGAMNNVISPYSSKGQADLSWARTHGNGGYYDGGYSNVPGFNMNL